MSVSNLHHSLCPCHHLHYIITFDCKYLCYSLSMCVYVSLGVSHLIPYHKQIIIIIISSLYRIVDGIYAIHFFTKKHAHQNSLKDNLYLTVKNLRDLVKSMGGCECGEQSYKVQEYSLDERESDKRQLQVCFFFIKNNFLGDRVSFAMFYSLMTQSRCNNHFTS